MERTSALASSHEATALPDADVLASPVQFMNKKWSPRDLHEIEAATAEPEDASSD